VGTGGGGSEVLGKRGFKTDAKRRHFFSVEMKSAHSLFFWMAMHTRCRSHLSPVQPAQKTHLRLQHRKDERCGHPSPLMRSLCAGDAIDTA